MRKTVKMLFFTICKEDFESKFVAALSLMVVSSRWGRRTGWNLWYWPKKKAKKMFDELLSYSNHLGLFSEDIDFKSKELLGNFPQAYSHLALIETAFNFNS